MHNKISVFTPNENDILDAEELVLYNKTRQINSLSDYVAGMAGGTSNLYLAKAAIWLKRLANNTCGQGQIGCPGGEDCKSDHC